MEGLPRYYTILFNAVTDALRWLESGDPAAAEECLRTAQQDAEEAYITEE